MVAAMLDKSIMSGGHAWALAEAAGLRDDPPDMGDKALWRAPTFQRLTIHAPGWCEAVPAAGFSGRAASPRGIDHGSTLAALTLPCIGLFAVSAVSASITGPKCRHWGLSRTRLSRTGRRIRELTSPSWQNFVDVYHVPSHSN